MAPRPAWCLQSRGPGWPRADMFSTAAFHAHPPAEGPPRAGEGRVLCRDGPRADPRVGAARAGGRLSGACGRASEVDPRLGARPGSAKSRRTPTCGRGGQGLPAEARRSDHSNRKGRGTGTWPGACGVRRAQTLLRLFLGAGGTGRKAPAESGPGRADGGPGGEEDGLRPGDGASWQGPSGCASAQKAGSWVEPGLAAGERVPG